MNARLYDPVLARMLSPDNFIHEDAGLNGYNRYSYALNNPLKFTDPDGNHPLLVAMAIGAVVNAFILTAQAEGSWNPTQWKWDSNTFGNLALGGIIGAASGCVGYGFSAGIAVNGIGSAIFAGAVGGATGGTIGGAFNAAALGGDARDIGMGAIQGFVGGAIFGGAIGGASYYIGKFFASFKNNRAVPSTPDTPEPVTANEVVKESISIDPIEPIIPKADISDYARYVGRSAERYRLYMEGGSKGVDQTRIKLDGAGRTAKYGANWQRSSLKETIFQVTGNTRTQGISNANGTKTMYIGKTSRVVYDHAHNYFTIETLVPSAKPYLDINGKVIPNHIIGPSGSKVPVTEGMYKQMTHFMNSD